MRQPDTATPTPPVGHQLEAATDLRSLFDTLAERAWIIGLCVVVALLGAAYYAKRAPRSYEATATVQVEQEAQRLDYVGVVVGYEDPMGGRAGHGLN